MEAKSIYNLLRPVVNGWNKDHEYAKVSMVLDDDTITLSPIMDGTGHFRFSGVLLTDIALLSQVYGFCWGIHMNANGNAPYILI